MLTALTSDVQCSILKYVDIESLGNLALCNSEMARIVNQEKLWQFKCLRKFPTGFHSKPTSLTFRRYYYRLLLSQVHRLLIENREIIIYVRKMKNFRGCSYILAADNTFWEYKNPGTLTQVPYSFEDFTVVEDTKMYVIDTAYNLREFNVDTHTVGTTILASSVYKIDRSSKLISVLTLDNSLYASVDGVEFNFVDTNVKTSYMLWHELSVLYITFNGQLKKGHYCISFPDTSFANHTAQWISTTIIGRNIRTFVDDKFTLASTFVIQGRISSGEFCVVDNNLTCYIIDMDKLYRNLDGVVKFKTERNKVRVLCAILN